LLEQSKIKGEKMKKTLTLCALLLMSSSQVLAQDAPAQSSATLFTSPLATWQMNVKPIDFAQSLDNRLVFVLGDDSKVHIYSSADGVEQGAVPVAKETVAIDIAPRGEMLFLVDSNKNYTALDISFAQDIDTTGSPFLGKEDAPVTLVVFSDFQCPFCSKVQPLLEEIL
jgi:protein-disulfide isomerase